MPFFVPLPKFDGLFDPPATKPGEKPSQNLFGDLDPAVARAMLNAGASVPGVSPENGGGGGGGGGGGEDKAPASSKDWADIFWGSLGLPDDVIAQINSALAGVTDDATAQAVGTNVLRASKWYQDTFPGIAYGIRNGLFTDEQGYRDYVNQLNVLYQQYQGRAVTTNEVTGYLQNGLNSSIVGRQLQGGAIVKAESPELQFEAGAYTTEGRLSDQELTAYGQEKAGLDSPLGQIITNRLQLAQQKLTRIAQGTLGTPSLSMGPQGLFSPSLQGQKERSSAKTGSPDVGAV